MGPSPVRLLTVGSLTGGPIIMYRTPLCVHSLREHLRYNHSLIFNVEPLTVGPTTVRTLNMGWLTVESLTVGPYTMGLYT